MTKNNQENQDVLNKVKGFYESAVSSKTYKAWRDEAVKAWEFYDGEQWTRDEISALQESSQPAIVINKIAPKIDNIAGSEIATRTRVVYQSRSGETSESETARALTDLALYVAERNDQSLEISNMFKAGLVTGIGWLDVGVEKRDEGAFIFNRYENELDVVFDPLSRRDDYSDARFVCRSRYLSADSLQAMFGDKAGKLVERLQSHNYNYAGLKAAAHDDVSYFDEANGMVKVVEVQYKVSELQYRVEAPTGEVFVTFDKQEAYSSPASFVETAYAPRVYVAYFAEDTLLQHVALGYKHGRFSLTPFIYKRERKNGQPYGVVRGAIDPQRELNKRRSKAMHLLSTAQVIADIDAVEDPNMLAREAARPDGIILKRPGKELRIIRNAELASSQVAVMDKASLDIQEVMGVFDESLGRESNATSGIAIQTRQVASNRNQMFAFDGLRRTKKALGEMVLGLIRQYFTHEMVINITDDLNAPRVLHLNKPTLDENGLQQMQYDVRSGVFDVHVEEVVDAMSSRELELQQLDMLMKAGVPVPHKVLVEATSLRNKDVLLAGGEDVKAAG